MAIATAAETRLAVPGSAMKTKGSTTGRSTGRPAGRRPPRRAGLSRSRATRSPAGCATTHCRTRSSSAAPSAGQSRRSRRRSGGAPARAGCRARRAQPGLAPRATRLRSTYITPSTKPQAMLQPIAAISMLRTSSRPLSTTLSVPVKVSTMNRPNSTSEMRSIGSSTAELPVSEECVGHGDSVPSRRQEACRTRRAACHSWSLADTWVASKF